jgi:hypothetical protein
MAALFAAYPLLALVCRLTCAFAGSACLTVAHHSGSFAVMDVA